MHWEAHEFALPALKKQMKWYQVAGTEEVPDEAECLKEQKMIEVKAMNATSIFICLQTQYIPGSTATET